MKPIANAAAGLLLSLLLCLGRSHARPTRPLAPTLPTGDAVFTATNEVSSLALEADGTLWVGTTGGILRFARDGWRKWTRRDGLPSHETRRLRLDRGRVTATFPTAAAVWQGGRWNRISSGAPRSAPGGEPVLCATEWNGKSCEATVTGLRIREGSTSRFLPLPHSHGTHISALLPHGRTLWAALFGEGLWSFDARGWRPIEIGLPPEAREITAMAANASTLWLGTRRAGVWRYAAGVWTHPRPFDDPCNHNVQMFAAYRDRLYVSTLEDGLAIRTEQGWKQATVPTLSSVAPRQAVVFQGALYVRHGNGKVDRLDGETWTRDVCALLPRKQTTMIAADSRRLYVGQWGGWSEFDGQNWTHHFEHRVLQQCPMTALLVQGETLWIGTQNHGLAEYRHTTGQLHWHDERQGLRDDWITALAGDARSITIGTFVGGMMRWEGGRWTAPQLAGENVTAVAHDTEGGEWIATRTGLWHRTAAGALTPARVPFLDSEIQALLATQGGLWIGARTGIFYLAAK
jgi:ligand-binding sensor domain-containing protein